MVPESTGALSLVRPALATLPVTSATSSVTAVMLAVAVGTTALTVMA